MGFFWSALWPKTPRDFGKNFSICLWEPRGFPPFLAKKEKIKNPQKMGFLKIWVLLGLGCLGKNPFVIGAKFFSKIFGILGFGGDVFSRGKKKLNPQKKIFFK